MGFCVVRLNHGRDGCGWRGSGLRGRKEPRPLSTGGVQRRLVVKDAARRDSSRKVPPGKNRLICHSWLLCGDRVWRSLDRHSTGKNNVGHLRRTPDTRRPDGPWRHHAKRNISPRGVQIGADV